MITFFNDKIDLTLGSWPNSLSSEASFRQAIHDGQRRALKYVRLRKISLWPDYTTLERYHYYIFSDLLGEAAGELWSGTLQLPPQHSDRAIAVERLLREDINRLAHSHTKLLIDGSSPEKLIDVISSYHQALTVEKPFDERSGAQVVNRTVAMTILAAQLEYYFGGPITGHIDAEEYNEALQDWHYGFSSEPLLKLITALSGYGGNGETAHRSRN